GQGWFRAMAQAQAGRPSWVWVPWPAPDGLSQAAVRRMAAQPALTVSAAMRGPKPCRGGRTESVEGVAGLCTPYCMGQSEPDSGGQTERSGLARANQERVPAQESDARGGELSRIPEAVGEAEQLAGIVGLKGQIRDEHDP